MKTCAANNAPTLSEAMRRLRPLTHIRAALFETLFKGLFAICPWAQTARTRVGCGVANASPGCKTRLRFAPDSSSRFPILCSSRPDHEQVLTTRHAPPRRQWPSDWLLLHQKQKQILGGSKCRFRWFYQDILLLIQKQENALPSFPCAVRPCASLLSFSAESTVIAASASAAGKKKRAPAAPACHFSGGPESAAGRRLPLQRRKSAGSRRTPGSSGRWKSMSMPPAAACGSGSCAASADLAGQLPVWMWCSAAASRPSAASPRSWLRSSATAQVGAKPSV